MTCKEFLLGYINQKGGFVKKVELYYAGEDWSPETIGRDLRFLEEEGKLKVDYYDGKYTKGLAMYTRKEYVKSKPHYEIIDGVAVQVNG